MESIDEYAERGSEIAQEMLRKAGKIRECSSFGRHIGHLGEGQTEILLRGSTRTSNYICDMCWHVYSASRS